MRSVQSIIKKKLIKVVKEKVTVPCMEGHYLDGRCALVTGGSSGIGFAIAEAFLKNGACVLITGRNRSKLEAAKISLLHKTNCSSDAVAIGVLDIADAGSIERNLLSLISQTKRNVDIFVNNAGVNGGELFPNTNEEDYDRILDTNLKGMYFVSQAAAKYMVNNGIQGNLLNVTSSSALRPAISPYIVSKWGERGLTLGMAKKYLPYGIIVNGIAPGSTMTPMLRKDNTNDLYLDYSPSKRYLCPEEIGNMATVLVSQMGRMIVGDTIYMTGGAGLLTFDDMTY